VAKTVLLVPTFLTDLLHKPSFLPGKRAASPNHAANDMQLIPIEKIVSNRDSIRKAREAFLIQKGRTIDPNGLNIREETYCFHFFSFIMFFYHVILLCRMLIFNLLYQLLLRISSIT